MSLLGAITIFVAITPPTIGTMAVGWALLIGSLVTAPLGLRAENLLPPSFLKSRRPSGHGRWCDNYDEENH